MSEIKSFSDYTSKYNSNVDFSALFSGTSDSSLSTDKKNSGTKKSYMGIVRKEEIGYSKNSYQI